MDKSLYFTADELAFLLNTHVRSINRLFDEQKFDTIIIGRGRAVKKSDWDNYIKNLVENNKTPLSDEDSEIPLLFEDFKKEEKTDLAEEDRISLLIEKMIEQKVHAKDIFKATKDPSFRQKMFEKYHI